jgi:hypothetical protein
MNRSVFLAIGLTGALAIVASPAAAQHRRGGGENAEMAAATRVRVRNSAPSARLLNRSNNSSRLSRVWNAAPDAAGSASRTACRSREAIPWR